MADLTTRCTACGSVEVEINKPYRVLPFDGELYRTGYGCEVCD